MKFIGDKLSLIRFGAMVVDELWIIRYEGKICMIDTHKRKVVFDTKKQAIAALEKHLFFNFCQGHYWHGKTNNTFEQFGKWDSEKYRTVGSPLIRDDKTLKKQAKELAFQLMLDGVFVVERLKL